MSLKLFQILCLFRCILLFVPQTGYIHPDEHFQGPEIVYGDILQLRVLRTWDFTTEKPIRNIVFPYFVTGLPALLADSFGIGYLTRTNLYPYLLLVLPRIIMCCISFINDILIYKLCILMKKNHKKCLTMFSSSYITLVYLTRTFSNCFEVLFFSITIYLVCKLLHIKTIHKNTASDIYRISNTINISFILGLVTAMGIFNRPTFVCFAFFPLTVFTFLSLKMNEYNLKTKLLHFVSLFLGGISILISFTIIDSLYYNKIHYINMYGVYHNIISTPLNFILYNTNKSNLDSHGLHPHWLHACVNIPLLFSVYGIFVMLDFLMYLIKFFSKLTMNFKDFLLLSFITPLALLSVIPHQEPRFLLPLIFPLAMLHNDSYFCKFVANKYCVKLWYVNNILGLIFFGFLHQGGVYPSSSYIHSSLQNNSAVVFYKTYMPPRYLLALDQTKENINVHDFAGVDLYSFDLLINNVTHQTSPVYVNVVLPDEVVNSVLHLHIFNSRYKLIKNIAFFPHISTENLPKLDKIMSIILCNKSLLHKISKMQKMFSIHVLVFEVR